MTAKKVKTTVAQTEKPKVKSALKKTLPASKPQDAAPTKSSRPARKRAEDLLEVEADAPAVETVVETTPAKAKKTAKSQSVTTKPEESASAKTSKAKAKGKADKATKQAAVEESVVVAVVDEKEDEEEEEEDVDDQTAALLAGFESSEDENDPEEDEGVTLDKVPSIPNEKQLRKQLKAAEADDENTPGVIYVGYACPVQFEIRVFTDIYADESLTVSTNTR